MENPKNAYLIFLGAGASIPLGFPGGTELVNQFTENLQGLIDQDKGEMLKDIDSLKNKIAGNGFHFDSESLYSCLEGYSNPARWMIHSGPFASAMCKIQPVSSIQPDPIYPKLRELFEEFLITKFYDEDPFLKRRIKAVYNRLFAKISGIPDWRNSEPNWNNSMFEIFTTNFDRVIETYAEQVSQTICKGQIIGADDRVMFTPVNMIKVVNP